jgi:polyhydroxyalkanoate synthesis regulator phasin
MQEAMRTYLELAMGLTDTSRKKVRKVVKEAVGRGNATADQVKTMTSELMATNSANREALAKLVRFEVDRALGVVGLATAEEVTELTDRVRDLERQLREAGDGTSTAPARTTTAKKATTKKATTAPRKTTNAAAATAGPTTVTATKTAARKTGAKSTGAKSTGATKAVARKAVAKKAVAKKSVANKSVAKSAAAESNGAGA